MKKKEPTYLFHELLCLSANVDQRSQTKRYAKLYLPTLAMKENLAQNMTLGYNCSNPSITSSMSTTGV